MASILVVDDDEMFRRLVGKLIENAGHEPVLAADGATALASVAERTPDLVVTDMIMPDISGAELIRRLRADSATADLPVVVVSAHDVSDDLSDALEAGNCIHVSKTVDPDALIARIVGQLP